MNQCMKRVCVTPSYGGFLIRQRQPQHFICLLFAKKINTETYIQKLFLGGELFETVDAIELVPSDK